MANETQLLSKPATVVQAPSVTRPRFPASDKAVPKAIYFYIGAFDGGDWFEIKCSRSRIRFRAGGPFPTIVNRTVQCEPDPIRWTRFWEDLEWIGVWNWKPDYSDPGVLDGGYWRLVIRHAERRLRTGGDNGYPGSDGPEYPTGCAFDQFLCALENLTGIRDLR